MISIPSEISIVNIDISSTQVIFTTLIPNTLGVGTVVRINDDVNFNKFFKISAVTTYTFTVESTDFDSTIKYSTKTMLVNIFKTRRVDTMDEMNYTLAEMKGTSLLWSDNLKLTDGIHATWKHESAYKQTHLYNQKIGRAHV